MAPASLTALDLDKRSPQFLIAHVQHFKWLKSDFPVLNKTMYYETNKSALNVSLRRFQEWFKQYKEDLDRVRKPKLKKGRHQNKVICQADKTRFTAQQKLQLIKPNAKTQIHIPKKLFPRAMPKKQGPKKRPQASMDVPEPPPGAPGAPTKRFKPNESKPSSIPSRR